MHQILSGFVWEEEALKRAKQSFLQSHETLVKSLEGRSTESLMERMSGSDPRFMSIPQEHIEVRFYHFSSVLLYWRVVVSHVVLLWCQSNSKWGDVQTGAGCCSWSVTFVSKPQTPRVPCIDRVLFFHFFKPEIV